MTHVARLSDLEAYGIRGFGIIDLAGGCYGLADLELANVADTEDPYMYVLQHDDADDCDLPTTTRPVILWTRNPEGRSWSRTFPNVQAFADWYKATEHVLPENGDGSPESRGWTREG